MFIYIRIIYVCYSVYAHIPTYTCVQASSPFSPLIHLHSPWVTNMTRWYNICAHKHTHIVCAHQRQRICTHTQARTHAYIYIYTCVDNHHYSDRRFYYSIFAPSCLSFLFTSYHLQSSVYLSLRWRIPIHVWIYCRDLVAPAPDPDYFLPHHHRPHAPNPDIPKTTKLRLVEKVYEIGIKRSLLSCGI